jgi:hypothetical protein
MNAQLIVLILPAIPIVAYCDYIMFRRNWESEYHINVKWQDWIMPVFMEFLMFFLGIAFATLMGVKP